MAKSNENNPMVMVISLGSLAADETKARAYLAHAAVIKSVSLLNNAVVAASDTDYVQVALKIGSTTLAELDSRGAHENGLADAVAEPLNLASATVAAGSVLKVDYQETGTVQLTDATLVVEYYPL